MANTDVKEMVNLCVGLGLRVNFEGAGQHYTVRDPDSDAKLFYISSTPSDTNFKYEIARHLRRLGLLKGNLKFGKFRTVKAKKRYGPIDMVALRKAQEQAESAGERIPLLEDINGQPEFFRKMRAGTMGYDGYIKEAQQEAIDNMAMKLSPRGAATKARLRKTLKEKNISNTEFVKLAMEVADERGLRGWTKLNTGQSAIGTFVKHDDKTMQIWAINLVEATLDKIDGMRFDTEPPVEDTRQREGEPIWEDPPEGSKIRESVPKVTYVTEETLGNILVNFRVEIEKLINEHITATNRTVNTSSNWKDKYAEVLLARLADLESSDDPEIYMTRLDKLVG